MQHLLSADVISGNIIKAVKPAYRWKLSVHGDHSSGRGKVHRPSRMCFL